MVLTLKQIKAKQSKGIEHARAIGLALKGQE